MSTQREQEYLPMEDLLGQVSSELLNAKLGGSGIQPQTKPNLSLNNMPKFKTGVPKGTKLLGKNSAAALNSGLQGIKNGTPFKGGAPGAFGSSGGGTSGGVGGALGALQMFKKAGQALDGITGIFGLNTEQVDQFAAERAGFGTENKLTGIINKIPGAKFMTAFGATTIQNLKESAYWDTVGSGFSGTRKDTNAAKSLSGKRMLFGANKANAFVETANAQNAAINRIGMQSEMARANDVGQLYQQQNFNKYQGYSPTLLLSRKGGTIPELEDSRRIIKNVLKPIVAKYQLGGKIIDPSKNIIPDGALHKNLNHLFDANEELVDQITRKGVPVVSEDAEGNITQHAEVEVGEIIFTLENSQKLEEYWKQYKETGDDNIAIECGKFVTHEILRNTVDKAGIKKQVE